MLAKKLKNGQTAYYWNPPKRDIDAGFPLQRESLGRDYGAACIRCDGDAGLNRFLDDWRSNRGVKMSLDFSVKFGTVDWWIETYFQSHAFTRLAARTKPGYRWHLTKIADMKTETRQRLGELPVKSITPAAVDKIYLRLTASAKLRTANNIIDTARVAWRVVQRGQPDLFATSNPFVGLIRTKKSTSIAPVRRDEALALSEAIKELGHPYLALAPLICFDWLQRPENLIGGHFKWVHYRPADKPRFVRIRHHKTDRDVWHPLEDEDGPFYAELEAMLANLPRIAVPVIVTPGNRAPSRVYSRGYAQRIVRQARKAAGLPDHVTLAGCRHGGMTELDDAELTEQGIMSLSGHTRPDAARLYVKKTEIQRLAASRRRRAWRRQQEQSNNESQNKRQDKSQNDTS